jgi:uncharacterized protein YqeY
MTLREKIFSDLTEASKKGEVARRDALRLLFSAVKNTEIEKLKKETGLSDEEVMEVVARSIKQRRDSIEQYEAGKREDLAEKERKEIEILSAYLPEQMNDEAIEKNVQEIISEMGEVSVKDLGRIMGVAMQRLKGKADGNRVREKVLKILG